MPTTRSHNRNTTKRTISLKVCQFIFNLPALNNGGQAGHPAGVRINNQKYYTVNFDTDAGTWYLKKEKGGACCTKTKTAVVIGTFSSTIQMENNQP